VFYSDIFVGYFCLLQITVFATTDEGIADAPKRIQDATVPASAMVEWYTFRGDKTIPSKLKWTAPPRKSNPGMDRVWMHHIGPRVQLMKKEQRLYITDQKVYCGYLSALEGAEDLETELDTDNSEDEGTNPLDDTDSV
jgi:hypothetical protein